DTSREVHEMFKTTAIDTLKQDKKCQACWYMILSTMSGSTTINTLCAQSILTSSFVNFSRYCLLHTCTTRISVPLLED
ncbi:MAG: hypothetical protein WCC17_24045, partial [Candidatus Nitrosopolaris sp.]